MSIAPGARLISEAGTRWARVRRFCSAAEQREAKPARALSGARGGMATDPPNEFRPTRGATHLEKVSPQEDGSSWGEKLSNAISNSRQAALH